MARTHLFAGATVKVPPATDGCAGPPEIESIVFSDGTVVDATLLTADGADGDVSKLVMAVGAYTTAAGIRIEGKVWALASIVSVGNGWEIRIGAREPFRHSKG